ncbi:MAG: NB-ARC domain-containing protein [Kibdelosporangium sp.]
MAAGVTGTVHDRGPDLGALLTRYRRRAGLTQEQLSERSGVSVRAISDLEGSRVRWPQRRTRAALLAALDVTGEEQAEFLRATRDGRVATPETPWAPGAPLPSSVTDFTGRRRELADLSARASGVVVLHGPPGIGKTCTAIQFGHLTAERWPAGRVLVTFGADADDGAALVALGVPEAEVPGDTAGRTEMYRQVLGSRRLLLVLDDVVDVQQVRAVPAGVPGSLVVITSRRPLTELAGVARIRMDVLPEEEALRLLGAIAGPDRIAAEPDAAREIVRLCDHLPLTLRVAGSRLASRPAWPVLHLVEQLRHPCRRFSLLTTTDQRIGDMLATSCARLRADTRRLFQRVARDGLGEPVPPDVLADLVDAGLVLIGPDGPVVPGLARAYAEHRLDAGM